MGTWALDDAASADVAAAVALMVLALALWQQRIGAQQALRRQQDQVARHQAELVRLREQAHHQVLDTDQRWQEYHHRQMQDLQQALAHLAHVRLPAALSGLPIPSALDGEAVGQPITGWLDQVVQAAVQAAENGATMRRLAAERQHGENAVAGLRGELREWIAALRQDTDRWNEHLSRFDGHFTTILGRLESLGARASGSSEPEREVLVSIGRRLHALVGRALAALTSLERQVEDPDLLYELYRIDHLVTQSRRVAARLAVLGGETARRGTEPVVLATVLRQAVAEVEHYERVRVVLPRTKLALPGYAGPDVTLLLAELVENATRFSPPQTQVLMRTAQTPEGLAIEIEDRGLSMSAERLATMNRLLAAPEKVDVRRQLKQGQIGLLVAARLARRHDIRIELRPVEDGGTQARVLVPGNLLAPPKQPTPHTPTTKAGTPGTVPNDIQAGVVAVAASAPPRISAAAMAHAPDELPTRRRNATSASPAGSHGAVGDVPLSDGRPPLPQRRSTQHREPASSEPPSTTSRPATPGLMAGFTEGVRRGAHSPAAKTPRPDAATG
ncbi:sensor histidine kinase [Thermomonospora cellulosilytica]|uniref:histidine kinase n=1 Tax=Thermomonospora cellulosilytica TaxID=1411118 RepID=A0A7W3MVT7_9ACTN|nr:ATP-binding protein [Thermomonospora cellulosilytica]MBA9002825.1 signal transduction histidine kinase [Thermomonospora cellulosilytica]